MVLSWIANRGDFTRSRPRFYCYSVSYWCAFVLVVFSSSLLLVFLFLFGVCFLSWLWRFLFLVSSIEWIVRVLCFVFFFLLLESVIGVLCSCFLLELVTGAFDSCLYSSCVGYWCPFLLAFLSCWLCLLLFSLSVCCRFLFFGPSSRSI